MYLNGSEVRIYGLKSAGLTLTWDVFKSDRDCANFVFKIRLTLTWDVFKFI